MVKKKYNSLILILLFLSWLSFWFSINTKPDEIGFSFSTDIILIINTLRILVPLLIIIILIPLIIFFVLRKRIFFTQKSITNSVFLFSVYFVLQFVGLYFNINLNFLDLNNSYLIILGIGSLQIIFLLKIFNLNKNFNLFLYASIFFIVVVFFVLIFSMLKNKTSYDWLYLYYYIDLDQKLLEQNFPRITGLARMMGIINLTILTSFLFLRKNKNLKKIEFFLIIILSILIWSSQSRGAILCFYICLLTLFCFYREYNLKKKLIVIFFIIFFPILVFESYKFYKMNAYVKIEKNKDNLEEFYRLNQNRILRSTEQGSSGRIDLWKYVIEKYDKKKFFGYGPQADRFLISKKLNQQYGNNVSNGFLYAFACGGYFALIVFILINFKILLFVYKSIFVNKIFQIKYYFAEKLATIFLIFFLIRVTFENSYALFSIDFLITLISLVILEKYFGKKKLFNF